MSEIRASVIIATYNGATKIGALLEALLLQSDNRFETIVVVDGSIDNTSQILKAYTPRLANLKIIEQHNAGRSVARNRGSQEAVGGFLIFYDDDMEPARNSIERHIELLTLDSNRIITGMITETSGFEISDIQMYKAGLAVKWMSEYSQAFLSQKTVETIFFSAANCSIPKNIFDRLKGFDIRLNDAEDHDLAYRAVQMGIEVFFDMENEAIHHDLITCTSYIKRLREYQIAHRRLAALHPERTHSRLYHETNIWKLFIYRMFAQKFLVKLIDQEKLLFVPKKIRYKLYNIIIHSLGNVFPAVEI